MCCYIAHHAQVVIAQVDFRLAPEFLVPAQVEDCVEAYKWVSLISVLLFLLVSVDDRA